MRTATSRSPVTRKNCELTNLQHARSSICIRLISSNLADWLLSQPIAVLGSIAYPRKRHRHPRLSNPRRSRPKLPHRLDMSGFASAVPVLILSYG